MGFIPLKSQGYIYYIKYNKLCLLGMDIDLCVTNTFFFFRHWDSYTDDGFDFDIYNVNLIYTCFHKNLVFHKNIDNKY